MTSAPLRSSARRHAPLLGALVAFAALLVIAATASAGADEPPRPAASSR